MEQWIIYSMGFVFVFWLTSISIQVIKLLKIWFTYKLSNLKEYQLWD